MSEVSDVSIAEPQTVVIHLIVMSLEGESQPQAPLGVAPKPLAKLQRIYTSGVYPMGGETILRAPDEHLL